MEHENESDNDYKRQKSEEQLLMPTKSHPLFLSPKKAAVGQAEMKKANFPMLREKRTGSEGPVVNLNVSCVLVLIC